jgi:hypothetical protein
LFQVVTLRLKVSEVALDGVIVEEVMVPSTTWTCLPAGRDTLLKVSVRVCPATVRVPIGTLVEDRRTADPTWNPLGNTNVMLLM